MHPKSALGALYQIMVHKPNRTLSKTIPDFPVYSLASMSERLFNNPENSPHAWFHVPCKAAWAVEVISGTPGAVLKLDVELISNTYSALQRDDPGKWIPLLLPPCMVMNRNGCVYPQASWSGKSPGPRDMLSIWELPDLHAPCCWILSMSFLQSARIQSSQISYSFLLSTAKELWGFPICFPNIAILCYHASIRPGFSTKIFLSCIGKIPSRRIMGRKFSSI